jgi:hypothetical protein
LTAASQDASKKEAAKATPTSQDKQAEALPWQTRRRLYVSELAKQLQNVTFPYFLNGDGGFKNVFVGKWVEFDGVMPTGFKGEQGEDIPLEMEPQTLAIPAKLFSPSNGPGILEATVRILHLRFESSAFDQWKSVQAGTHVRFRVTLAQFNILLGTTQNGGVVTLSAQVAVPLPGK